jgi:protein-disulfide isomerase
MKAKTLIAAAVLALAIAGCGGDAAGGGNATAEKNFKVDQIAAPNGGDWTQSVSQTPSGGYLMGNPAARVKLVEYGSLSCSHCAEFSEKGSTPLRDKYVKSGQVSWEFRPYLLFAPDAGVTSVLRCMGPEAFFPLSEQLYESQPEWLGKLQQMPPELQAQLQTMTPAQQSAALVKAAGLDQFFRQRGVPEARLNTCLADQKALEALAALTAQGNREGVTGTPTFFINGNVLPNVGEWKTLEPAIQQALK